MQYRFSKLGFGAAAILLGLSLACSGNRTETGDYRGDARVEVLIPDYKPDLKFNSGPGLGEYKLGDEMCNVSITFVECHSKGRCTIMNYNGDLIGLGNLNADGELTDNNIVAGSIAEKSRIAWNYGFDDTNTGFVDRGSKEAQDARAHHTATQNRVVRLDNLVGR